MKKIYQLIAICLLLIFQLFSSNISAQSDPELVGYWKLDEGSGNTLNDNSIYGNTATLQNTNDVSWVTGKEGLGLKLPGTLNRFAIAPNSTSLNFTDKISITAWIKPVEKKNSTIISKAGNDGFELGTNKKGYFEFMINSDTYGSDYKITSNTSYPVDGNTWVHIAAVFDGASSKIYINGVLDAVKNYSTSVPIIANSSGLYIGSLLGSKRLAGVLDEIRLYHGALTDAEIATIAGGEITAPATAPTLIAPANGASNISITPTLSWSAVPGATAYRVEVSASSNFTNLVFSQDNVTATSIVASGLANATTYFWRVRGLNSAGNGPWPTAFSFTTVENAPASAPTLIAPTNGASNISITPTLSWSTVPGATAYRVEVSASSNFANLVFSQDNVTATSVVATGLANATTYFWRVRGLNSAGNGPWPTAFSFTTVENAPASAPTLIAPTNDASNISITPTLSWSTVPGATAYRVEVSASSNFANLVFSQDNVTATSIVASGLANATTYFWRVRGLNSAGNGPWPTAFSFTTVENAPASAPTLIAPTNGASNISITPTLSWSTVPGATAYRVEVSASSNFANLVFSQDNVTATSIVATGLANATTYFWRVRGLNSAGNGPWPTAFSFTTVENAPASAPTLIAPTNGASNISITPTLSWSSVPGATAYRVEVSASSNFANLVFSQDNVTATSIVASGLANATTYFWRVRGLNSAGNGPWPTAFSFTTVENAPASAPTLIAPTNGASNISITPTLSWSSVPGATAYRVEVSASSNFANLVFSQDNVTATSIVASGLANATTYFWRVRGLNSAGNGPWPTAFSFTTNSQSILSGFASITKVNPIALSGHTADKPQAKTWKYDNKWWTILSVNSGGTKLFRLDGTSWTEMLTIATFGGVKADCRVVGNLVHALLYRSSNPSYIISLEYDAVNKTYKRWTQNPNNTPINLDSGVETAAIAIDGNAVLWIANAGTTQVHVRWSAPPYTSFSTPIAIADGINDDDICSITPMPGKVAVFWSNQNTERFGFKTHIDGTNPATWTADEVPASQSALNVKDGMADDHLSGIAASDGTLYYAVKTGYDTQGYTQVAMLVRRPNGTWDNLYAVSDSGSRPYVILNEAKGLVKVLYTTTGDDRYIKYREASTTDLIFSEPYLLIGDDNHHYDYSTSTHETYDNETVIIVTDETNSPKMGIALIASEDPLFTVEGSSSSPAMLEQVRLTLTSEPIATKLSPNPVQNRINLRLGNAYLGKRTSLMITDLLGRVRMQSTQIINNEMTSVDISRYNLPRGVYFLRITSKGKTENIRFLKD